MILLHSLDAADYFFKGGELGGYVESTYYEIHREKVQKQFDGYLVGEFPGAVRQLSEGEACARIVEYARSNAIDLIMMPSHGLGPFRRFLIGSVTAKVLHDAHCPVWTGVHMESAPPTAAIEFKNIYCALDLGPEAGAPLRWAADLAAANHGMVTIVHAVPGVETRPGKYLMPSFMPASGSRPAWSWRNCANAWASMPGSSW